MGWSTNTMLWLTSQPHGLRLSDKSLLILKGPFSAVQGRWSGAQESVAQIVSAHRHTCAPAASSCAVAQAVEACSRAMQLPQPALCAHHRIQLAQSCSPAHLHDAHCPCDASLTAQAGRDGPGTYM
jgi:hypothetical protein